MDPSIPRRIPGLLVEALRFRRVALAGPEIARVAAELLSDGLEATKRILAEEVSRQISE